MFRVIVYHSIWLLCFLQGCQIFAFDEKLADESEFADSDTRNIGKDLTRELSHIIADKIYNELKREGNLEIKKNLFQPEWHSENFKEKLPPLPRPPGLWGKDVHSRFQIDRHDISIKTSGDISKREKKEGREKSKRNEDSEITTRKANSSPVNNNIQGIPEKDILTSNEQRRTKVNKPRALRNSDEINSPPGLWGRERIISPPGLWGRDVHAIKSPPGLWGREVLSMKSPPGLWGRDADAIKERRGLWRHDVESRNSPPGLWGREVESHHSPPGLWGREIESRNSPPGLWGREVENIKSPPGLWGREVENLKSPPGLWGREVENVRKTDSKDRRAEEEISSTLKVNRDSDKTQSDGNNIKNSDTSLLKFVDSDNTRKASRFDDKAWHKSFSTVTSKDSDESAILENI